MPRARRAVSGEIETAPKSSILSLDGTSHFDRSDSSVLKTDPQITPAESREIGENGEIGPVSKETEDSEFGTIFQFF